MKYLDKYIDLMELAMNRETPKGYTEKHHIVPKSWWANSYVVELTAKEHLYAHRWLHLAFPEDTSMAIAYNSMFNLQNKDHHRDFDEYTEMLAESREASAKAMSYLHKHPTEAMIKGRKVAGDKQRACAGNLNEAQKVGYKIMGEKQRGRPVSQETRDKLSKSRKKLNANPTQAMMDGYEKQKATKAAKSAKRRDDNLESKGGK